MCTSLRITSKDGSTIVGRTMDLYYNLGSKALIVPENFSQTSPAPNNKAGKSWTSKYGFVGMNSSAFSSTEGATPANKIVMDGVNEIGLFAAALYLPGYTKYQDISESDYSKAVSPYYVINYLLSNATTVNEAKKLMSGIIVWSDTSSIPGMQMELHYVVHDVTGSCAVFEYINGALKIYDNPSGVMTNSPPLDWQLINLGNYVNTSADNADAKTYGTNPFNKFTVKPLGEGSGTLGLPGDPTPVSRFVRGVTLTQSALPAMETKDATVTMFHILDNFDFVKGAARPLPPNQTNCDYTQWSTISDLADRYYYVRMHDSPGYARIKLMSCDLKAKDTKEIDVSNIAWFTDVS